MKIKNVDCSAKFRVSQLLSKSIESDEDKACSDALKDLANLQLMRPFTTADGNTVGDDIFNNSEAFDALQIEYRQKVIDTTPEWAQAEVTKHGCESLADFVPLKLTVGTVLFDLWRPTVSVPAAPLAAALLNKKISEYATLLSSDEYEVPGDVLAAAEKVLSDEEKWKTSVLSAQIDISEDRKEYTNVRGSILTDVREYHPILAEIINLFVK